MTRKGSSRSVPEPDGTITVKVRMPQRLKDAATEQAKRHHHTLSSWTRYLYDKALSNEVEVIPMRAASHE